MPLRWTVVESIPVPDDILRGSAGAARQTEIWIESMRSHGMFIGTLQQVADQVKALQAVGCTRWHFQLVPVDDDGMLDLIAGDLVPRCA